MSAPPGRPDRPTPPPPRSDYRLAGGTLRVVGLSYLGQREDHDEGIWYDDCYQEDRDNYIDIILVGDEAAARHVEAVEIPSLEGGYSAFYNPGGPGPEPFDGVTYTAPGSPDTEPVVMASGRPDAGQPRRHGGPLAAAGPSGRRHVGAGPGPGRPLAPRGPAVAACPY